jgi:hypothetical protein
MFRMKATTCKSSEVDSRRETSIRCRNESERGKCGVSVINSVYENGSTKGDDDNDEIRKINRSMAKHKKMMMGKKDMRRNINKE